MLDPSGTAYGIRTRDLRLERAVSWAARRTRQTASCVEQYTGGWRRKRKVPYSLTQNVTGGVTVPSEEKVTEGTGAGRRANDG